MVNDNNPIKSVAIKRIFYIFLGSSHGQRTDFNDFGCHKKNY